jgi:hypothetical protein
MSEVDDTPNMTAKEALAYAAEHFGVPSAYAMAKSLSDEKMTVQPIQISHYLKGKKMSRRVADRFNEVYGIIITDVHESTGWARIKE